MMKNHIIDLVTKFWFNSFWSLNWKLENGIGIQFHNKKLKNVELAKEPRSNTSQLTLMSSFSTNCN
jgi:hypothetical protein